jgi:hypothetical protein
MNTAIATNTTTYKWKDVQAGKMMQQSAPNCNQYTEHTLLKGGSKYNIKFRLVNGMHINFHDSAPSIHHHQTHS